MKTIDNNATTCYSFFAKNNLNIILKNTQQQIKHKSSIIVLFILLSIKLFSQSPHADQAFKTVGDIYGNTYNLTDISTDSPNPFGRYTSSNNTSNYTPTCSAGYFVLHYAPFSLLATSTIASTVQNVICQVFSDISNFIDSPLAASGNTVKIHIFCDDLQGPNTNGSGATASPVHVYPNNPTNSNQGFHMNQIQRGIQSGIDPFSNLSLPGLVNSANYYSGYLNINNLINWNYAINTSTQTVQEFDMYSIVLHEVIHSLGFYTLINHDGFSKAGASNNFYSYYDKFLFSHNLTPLLISTNTSSCVTSDIIWNPSLTPSLVLGAPCSTANASTDFSAPSNCGTNAFYSSSNNTLVALYTPTCYQGGSTLSHFEDMCSVPNNYTNVCTPTPTAPGFNNLYYTMANAIGPGDCYIRRYPKPEERYVLCDLGYTVKNNYISTNNSVIIANGTYSYGSYPGGTCAPTPTIIGNHDGIIGGIYQFTTTGSSITLTISSDILSNDIPNSGTQMSCFELVYASSASYTNNGTILTVTATPASGLVIFKYLPKHISSGNFGPPTYIFLYFLPTTCVPSTLCDHVENGGFENQNSGTCGDLQGGGPVVNCWRPYYFNGPELLVNGCPTGTIYNLGANTRNTTPPVSSYNGTLNTHVVGIKYLFQTSDHEAIQNNLAIPLSPPSTNTTIPTQTYQVSFWALNKAYSSSAPDINPNNSPCVINFASNPTYPILTPTVNQPNGLNSLINFTVPAGNFWTQYTGTFVVPTTSINQNCLVIGYNALQTTSLVASSSGTMGQYIYTFIDDISIKPINSVTFSIPGANNCGNSIITDLSQYATQIPGSFSGPGVYTTTNGTLTTYNFSATATGTYLVAFTYTDNNMCSGTVYENIIVHPPDFNISINSTNLCLNTSAPAIATASVNSSDPYVFNWQPGFLAGATQTISSASTIFTITAQYTACILSQTFAVPTSSTCCVNTMSFTEYGSTLFNSNLSGNYLINNDILVPSGSNVTISDNFLFAPNTKITVQNGAFLKIIKSHLYACSTEMWEGIEIEDGGFLELTKEQTTDNDNLIEDAITAVNILPQTTTTLTQILHSYRTTFNKNHTSIKVTGITNSVIAIPLAVNNCIFTCRDLPFTTTSWPQTGTVNATSTSSADLRYASTSTTDIAPPFLNQSTFTITNLKNPYNNHRSQIAISINSVGVNSGTVMYGCNIGSGANAADFNLFDAHVQFIVANNSNLTCINNVFQRTQSYTYTTNTTNFIPGKAAVEHNTSGVMNTKLFMSATSKDLGNRFWDCHIGVFGNDVYTFNIENAIFSSTQSTAALTSTFFTPVGGTGICLNTNRFEYYIAYNKFININNSINIPISVGTFTSGYFGSSTLTGIFAGDLRIYANTFETGTLTTNYSNNAVTITAPHNTPYDYSTTYTPYVPPSFSIPYNRAIVVTNNTLTGVFRGIYLNGITGFQTEIMNNSITMRTDATFSVSQYGIKLTNASPTSSTSVGKNIISANTVSISSATSQTNILGSLIYCGNNGYGICSPSVTCNNLTRGYQGFVFDNANKGTIWASNTMSTPIARGLVLDNAGEIGMQGSNAFATNNSWVGAWSASLSLYGTFTGSNSIAANSALWVKNNSGTVVTVPPANYGLTSNSLDWYDINSIPSTFYISNGGDHTCSQNPNNRPWSIPSEEDFISSDQYYMSKFALYRFLHFNDSLRNVEMELDDFYSENSSTSIGMFMQVEENLYDGNLTTASGILSEITTSNQIEDNYSQYYNLYISYADNDFQHTNSTDSTDLAQFALLCPGENGACVYQARALYNSVYNSIINDSECENSGARMASNIQETKMNKAWAVKIYPNPASSEISLLSTYQNDRLKINVNDLLGRLIIFEITEVKENLAKLTLDLENGVYLITIVNKDGQALTEKLIISK